MKTFDTVIIGAGPGGLHCATILARHGLSVLVLERHTNIGTKVCAGGIPYHALVELGIPTALHEANFPCQLIRTPWQLARVSFPAPVITTVNRERLGEWQLAEAIQAGAIIKTGTPATAINREFIETKAEKIGYRNLVGADGSASLVRRYLKISTRKVGAGINYQVPGQWPDMEWHLDPKLFGSGYAWIFPHRHSTSIGVYADRNDLSAATLHDRLLTWAKNRSIDLVSKVENELGNAALEEGMKSTGRAQAALINFDYQGWNFKPHFLVGDAAGLASGFTGEGIYPAIVSGETVARTILDNSFQPTRLNQLLARQKIHNRLQKFYTGNKVICQISLEMLVLAIRMRLLGFEVLEMY